MLAIAPSSQPAFRPNLHRPKPLLVECLRRARPSKVLAFDAEGCVYFDLQLDAFASSEKRQYMNWPLAPEEADLEQNLQLRDAIFTRHIELIRCGYLAHHGAKPLGQGDVIHLDGDQAFRNFLQIATSIVEETALWLLVENCQASDQTIAGFERTFFDPKLDVAIWGRPNTHFPIDFDIIRAGLEDAVNQAADKEKQEKSSEAEAKLAYHLLRDIQYVQSSVLQRLRQNLSLKFMYSTAHLLRGIAPKRCEKILRSARKRDPKIIDRRYINKIIRDYPQRLQLQQRLIESLMVKDAAHGGPSFSVIFDFRKHDLKQQVQDICKSHSNKNLQLVILSGNKDMSLNAIPEIRDGINILFLSSYSDEDNEPDIATAVEHCIGDYVLIAKPDCHYDEYFLSAAGRQLAARKNTSILYTDEDEIEPSGERKNPQFKPDWNRDLFYNADYLGSAVFVERHLLKSVAQEISNDTAALLTEAVFRALEQQGDCSIGHLDMILVSRSASSPPTSDLQHVTLLRSHLERIGYPDIRLLDPVDPEIANGACWLDWSSTLKRNLLVSMIIPTFNQLDLTRNAVTSILQKSGFENFEILLVDNNSNDPEMLEWLSMLPEHDRRIRVLSDPRPFNFSAINNAAFCHARGDIIGLVNNDIEIISEDWLEEMVSQAARPDIGCVGAKLLYPSGQIQHAGVNIDLVGDMRHLMRMYSGNSAGYMDRLGLQQNYLAVTGACLFLKRELYAAVGGLNQIELPIGCSDIDLCLKVQAIGLRNLWSPRARLFHHESISRGLDISAEKRARAAHEHAFMCERWKMVGEKDPYYNAAIERHLFDIAIGS